MKYPDATVADILKAGRVLQAAYRLKLDEYQTDASHPVFDTVLVADNGAPSTLAGLREVIKTGLLPVERSHCETSIYGVAGNLVFRGWHDSIHLAFDLGMCLADEIEVALIGWEEIRDTVRRALPGLTNFNFVKRVYFADTVGQSIYYNDNGCFVADQTKFVLDYVRTGAVQ